jgi:hypothetical protein
MPRRGPMKSVLVYIDQLPSITDVTPVAMLRSASTAGVARVAGPDRRDRR